MKRKYNNLLLIGMMLLLAISCRDESLVRIPTFENGPNVRFVPASPTIDFGSDLANVKVVFDVFSENKNLRLVDLKVFRTSGGANSDTATVMTFDQAAFDSHGGVIKGNQVTLAQIVAALKIPGGISSITLADSFTFLNFTTMSNGVIYPGKIVGGGKNLSPAIQTSAATTSFTSNFKILFLCPGTAPASPIEEGNYTATQTDDYIWFGGPNPLPSTNQVTITKIAGTNNQFLISDVTAGGYYACCASIGFKLNQPAKITDCFGSVIVTGKGTGAQINIGQGVTSGSWNATTKTLIVHYDDSSNGSLASGVDLVTKFVKN